MSVSELTTSFTQLCIRDSRSFRDYTKQSHDRAHDRIRSITKRSLSQREASAELKWLRHLPTELEEASKASSDAFLRDAPLMDALDLGCYPLKSPPREPNILCNANKRELEVALRFLIAPCEMLSKPDAFCSDRAGFLPRDSFTFFCRALKGDVLRRGKEVQKGKDGRVSSVKFGGDEPYALKELRSGAPKEAASRLSLEAVFYMRFSRLIPNLCPLRALKAGELYLKLADSCLYDRIKDIGDLSTIKRCLIEIARTLAAMHKYNIAHRDLKPENMLVVDGTLKLCDFGSVACVQSPLTIVGTSRYMAPEVLLQEEGCIWDKADVWSLGVVMYALITGGYHPFAKEGQTDFELGCSTMSLFRLELKSLSPLGEADKRDPQGLFREIARRSLHGNPDERLSAEKVLQLLEASY